MKKIGLVLAGGGGRGAYHIGVWKALRETGLDQYVSALAGTSVGALNAALFLQGDLKKAEKIWGNMSVEKILTPKYCFKPEFQGITYKQLKTRHKGIYMFIRDGLIKIIRENLDMSVFDNSDKNCYMTCCRTEYRKDMDDYEELFTHPDGSKGSRKYVKGKAAYFKMREFPYEDREKILLATSAMPFIFPKETIGGYYYMDGGSADNLPVEPLYVLEKCENIIVVHLTTNDGLIQIERKKQEFPNAVIREIRPKQDQGGLFTGILDFTEEGAIRRMNQGYSDTIGLFQNIKEDIEQEKNSIRCWKNTSLERKENSEKIRQGNRIMLAGLD